MPAAEAPVLAEIAALKPDVLWGALGVSRDREFCERHRVALAGVGIFKTLVGLSDVLAGAKRRAPSALRPDSLEGSFRLAFEPRRLFSRYFVTGPHALLAMLRTTR